MTTKADAPSPAAARVTAAIDACGVVAILRGSFLDRLDRFVAAIAEGGVLAIEISLTSPDAFPQIARAIAAAARLSGRDSTRDLVIGAGTVMSTADVRRVHDLGASFIVSPIVDPDVIAAALDVGLLPVPGAFTPTEVAMATRYGAPAVKLFPADALGPGFVRGVLAPLPGTKLVPTGGVTLALAGEFARAGAWAVGVGGPLVDAVSAEQTGGDDPLVARARAFVEAMRPSAGARAR